MDSNEKEYDTDLPAEKEMEMPEVEIPEKKEEVVVNQPQEEDQQPQQQNETNLL